MKKPKPRGGARKGAGRPESDTTPVLIRLAPPALAKIDAEVKRRKAAVEKPSPTRGSVIAERFL